MQRTTTNNVGSGNTPLKTSCSTTPCFNVFERGEAINYWYLMLSGEVELYVSALNQQPSTSSASSNFEMNGVGGVSATRLKILDAGSLFGDLNLNSHSCSARVRKTSEFVRIPQEHFFSLYKKHADHLQPFILVMEDLVSEVLSAMATPTKKERRPQSLSNARDPPIKTNSPYNFSGMRKELSAQLINNHHRASFNPDERRNIQPFNDDHVEYADESPPHMPAFSSATTANLFELSNSISLESRVFDAALVLKRTMQLKAPVLIGERRSQHMDCFEIFQNAMVGVEMTQWLGELVQQLFAASPTLSLKPPTNLQLIGMWQTLLDFHFISHVKHEQNFKDKHVFYRWTIDDPLEELYRNRKDDYSLLSGDGSMSLLPSSNLLQEFKMSVLQSSSGMDAGEDGLPTLADLQNAVFLLSNLGPDSMFRVILSKAPYERTPAEVEFVFEELLHIKALSHLGTMVKRELASVVRLEQHQHAGTVLFHQGERGESWYVLLRGSVDVSVLGKGVVCTLHEGDDFGKLALVNDAPRAATIALREDNSQFLRVDKHDFNRILRDVEENTVRLKEHGQDVLVLERIVQPVASTSMAPNRGFLNGMIESGKTQFSYSVMAGLPEKMVEYLLETRIDTVALDFNSSPGSENGFVGNQDQTFGPVLTNELDTFLEDFILTHIIFMPSNLLCNYLKNYYLRNYKLKGNRAAMTGLNNGTQLSQVLDSDFDNCERLTAKRRVVVFLAVWQYVLGIHFFLDSVANSFVEEMYCCVLEDAKIIPNMLPIVEQISQLRQLRENAMQILSRHPTLILDCGVYSAQAPAPNPILPIDICNQCIYLSDTTFITMNVRLDKPTAEIAALARAKIRKQRRHQHLHQLSTSHHLLRMDGIANGYPPQQMHRHLLRNGYREEEQEGGLDGVDEENQEEEEENCFLIEVKSNGERVVFAPTEVSVPTMLSLNGRLYVVFKEEIDSLLPLSEQEGPMEPTYHSVLDLLSCQELALQLSIFHTQLFEATDEIELVIQVIGRDQFPGRMPSNLDLLLRRFNEVQYWVSTEVLLASSAAKRLSTLKKFIKIAMHSKEHKDLMSLFAITLGLSNVAVSRLSLLWMKISNKMKRQYADFEALLDPSRNHRAYRLLVAKMRSPIVPFVPLLLKDLTFMHEGNKTSFAGLINFEKMQMVASVLKNFRKCKSNQNQLHPWPPKKSTQSLIRNFRVIDNQRRLMELSCQIEPPPNHHNNSNYSGNSSGNRVTHF